MNCSNCTEPALYTIKNPVANTVHYCERHLPGYLRISAHLGAHPVDAPVTSSKKKSAPVVTEPVVEEPVVEEAIVEDAPVEPAE